MNKNKRDYTRIVKVKNEIPHRALDSIKNKDKTSARYVYKIGYKTITQAGEAVVIDKVIYPINVCPHCKSKATFHRLIQENKDLIGNVWRGDSQETSKGLVVMKFDYCLDCHKDFLIELYIFSKMIKDIESFKKRKKRSRFRKWLKKVWQYI